MFYVVKDQVRRSSAFKQRTHKPYKVKQGVVHGHADITYVLLFGYVIMLCQLHRLYTLYRRVIMNQVLVMTWNNAGIEHF